MYPIPLLYKGFIRIRYLLNTLVRISRLKRENNFKKTVHGLKLMPHDPPPPSPATPRVVHRSQTINRTLPTTLCGSEKKRIKTVSTHNITDAMDNKIVTHFMQLNAKWSFYGSLVIFRQGLVNLTNLKYPCLYIFIVEFPGRGNLLKSDAVTFKSAQKIFEPWHGISNNVVCATSKASDQPAHMHSLIRAFASRLNIL